MAGRRSRRGRAEGAEEVAAVPERGCAPPCRTSPPRPNAVAGARVIVAEPGKPLIYVAMTPTTVRYTGGGLCRPHSAPANHTREGA